MAGKITSWNTAEIIKHKKLATLELYPARRTGKYTCDNIH